MSTTTNPTGIAPTAAFGTSKMTVKSSCNSAPQEPTARDFYAGQGEVRDGQGNLVKSNID